MTVIEEEYVGIGRIRTFILQSSVKTLVLATAQTFFTTILGLIRGASTAKDLYESVTECQRVYMRSININRLKNAELLEKGEENDYDPSDKEGNKTI